MNLRDQAVSPVLQVFSYFHLKYTDKVGVAGPFCSHRPINDLNVSATFVCIRHSTDTSQVKGDGY